MGWWLPAAADTAATATLTVAVLRYSISHPYGYGSKRKPVGTPGFGRFFLLSIEFLSYFCLTHSHIKKCQRLRFSNSTPQAIQHQPPSNRSGGLPTSDSAFPRRPETSLRALWRSVKTQCFVCFCGLLRNEPKHIVFTCFYYQTQEPLSVLWSFRGLLKLQNPTGGVVWKKTSHLRNL